jgi:hypothetical protein
MPTKLLPLKAEDQKSHPISKAGMEQHMSRAKWRSLHREEILEPDLPIIDPHHHLWDRPGNRYLLDEFMADVKTGHNIRASVFVECGSFYRKTTPCPDGAGGRGRIRQRRCRDSGQRDLRRHFRLRWHRRHGGY